MSQYGRVIDGQTQTVGYGLVKRTTHYWRVRMLTGRPQVLLFRAQDIDWTAIARRGMLKPGDLVECSYVTGEHEALFRITAKLKPDWKVWSGFAHRQRQVGSLGPGVMMKLDQERSDVILLVGPLDWAFKTLDKKLPEDEGWSGHHLCEILGD